MRIKRNNFLGKTKRWDGGGAGDGASAPETAPQVNEPPVRDEGDEATPPNYDELIKTDTVLQSWLDKKVNTATMTAVQNALEKERVLADEKATEAEKLARMSAAEKQEYLLKKAKSEIEQLKSQNAVRDLKDQAMKLAAEKQVPIPLVELLPYGSLKAEDVVAQIDGLKAVYDQAVADGIAQALSGAGTPQAGAQVKAATYTPEQLRGMSSEEINKNWDAVKASLEQKGR